MKLFRIDTQMKKVHEVPFTGTFLIHDDGLALDNHTLYVARNMENTFVEIKLLAAFWWATLVKSYTHPSFLFPSAVAKAKGGLSVKSVRPVSHAARHWKAAGPALLRL